ncbi:MAG: hypothetical protein JOY78_05485 [Pseudonocardia sp.]|nr:hypothetical protein [Pseudonocardia sp.]
MSVAPPGWNPDPNHAAGATPAQNTTQFHSYDSPAGAAAPVQFEAYDAPAAATGAVQFDAYDPPAPATGAVQLAAAPVAQPTLIQRNSTTFTAILVVALYLVLAKTTGIVLIGIFPAMLAFRAFQRREPLALVAVAAAAVAIIFSFTVVAGH